jgi:hypothetical protein
VIAAFTRASTVTHAANRVGTARVSIESKRDAICENRGGRPINRPLLHCHHQPPFRQAGGYQLLALVTLADSSFAASIGMSGSMTPSPRRGMLRREADGLVETPTRALVRTQAELLLPLRPEGRRPAGPGDRRSAKRYDHASRRVLLAELRGSVLRSTALTAGCPTRGRSGMAWSPVDHVDGCLHGLGALEI